MSRNKEDRGSVTLTKLTPLNDELNTADNYNDKNKINGRVGDNSSGTDIIRNGSDVKMNSDVSGVPSVKYELGDGNGDDGSNGPRDKSRNGIFSCCSCCGKKNHEAEDDRVGVMELFTFASTFDRLLMVIGLFGAVVLGCAIPTNMAVFGEVINTFVTDNETDTGNSTKYDNITEEMLPKIYFFAGIGATALVAGYTSIFCFQWTAERQVNTMRVKFFSSVMRQNIGWFDVHEAGEIGSHFSEDIAKIGEGIGDKLAVFVQWTSTWAAAYIMAFTRSWQLTLCVAIFSPIIVFLGGVILNVMRNFSMKEFKAYAKAGAVADQAFRAIRTVQAFQGQEKEKERYDSNLKTAVDVASRKGIALGMGQSALWFMVFLMFAAIMWLGIVFIQHLDVPPGNIIPVFLGVMIGSISLGNASNNLENFSTARGAAAKVYSMIALVPEIDGTSDEGLKPKELKAHIKLQNINFSYPARPNVKILNDFSLEIEPGKHIALVGSSGCGKSTVVQLLQRFYDPHYGTILLDGQDLKNYSLKWLRQKIGIVSQEPVLFDMTIADNIKFGKLDATQQEIEEAAKNANAHDFIKLLPQGYDTNVGERGAQLSGGQKQRIAIARALIRNPSILLLDEATSALDQESEAIVQNALNKAEKGRTTITIAHRLSTIKNADLIVSISEGQVIEMGTHKQLMDSKGLYFELVQLQTRLEKEGELADTEDNLGHPSLQSPLSMSPTRDIADVEIVEEDDDELDVTQGLLRASFRRTLSQESKQSVKQVNLVARSSKRSVTKDDIAINKKMLAEDDVKEVDFKTIMRYNTQEWHLILFGSFASLLGGGLHPCFSFLLSEFIKVFAVEDDEDQMNQTHVLAGVVLAVAVLSALIRMVQGYCFCRSGAKLTARLRSFTFESLVNQDMEYFDQPQNQVGSLTTKLASDAALVQGATGSKIGQILEALSCLIIAVIIAFVFGWKLALVVCAFLPFMIGAGIVQGYVIKGASKQDNKQIEEAGKICSEVLDNIRTVASLGREDYFFSRFETLINMNRKSNLKTSMVFGACYGIASSLLFFAYAVSFYYGSILVENGEMEFFNVFRVFAAIIFGGTMVGRQSSFGVDYAKAKMAASRIISLINRKPKVDVKERGGDKLSGFEGAVTVQNAVFHYPMRPTIPVLNGLDLSINPGETVALVGASGCGKSTLTQILQRFYELDGGSVSADSTDIRKLNLTWFRQQISIVSQEPSLFDCSIAENIAYGDNTRVVPMEEIIQAAKDANIHSFVSALPQGYDTNVGSKGTQLSGGQKQRIAIARALIRNPKILLLDEATSALDSESEKIVQEALDKASANRTCIIIAHRLSTIQNADRIAVVNKGKIVEMGPHSKLLAIKGAYYRLHSAQNRIVGI